MKTKSKCCKRARYRVARRGVTAVEFALTAPVLLLLVFGGMEFSRANMIRNAGDVAAFEGARAGILPGAAAQDCIDKAAAELAVLNVVGATIETIPTEINQNTTEVTVIVHIPLTENALPLSKFVIGKQLNLSITLKREIE